MTGTIERVDADVCIVGAGYAGLTATRRLVQGGRSVVVVEAHDRVGGRVWTRHGRDGVVLDMGGTFLGDDHHCVHALAAEMGVAIHPTYVAGDAILATGGKLVRYPSAKTPRINPLALASAGQAMLRLDSMARTVPLDAPWSAPKAAHWDTLTAANWVSPRNIPVAEAHDLIATTLRTLFTCDLSEVSMLNVLFLIHSGGGLVKFMSIEGGYQHFQVDGGAQAIADRMAEELGDAVRLEQPVRTIARTDGGVDVSSDELTVHARHAVVTVPPALAGHIRYEPTLPSERALLLNQLSCGSEVKFVAVYERAFWRDDGLCGATVAMDDPFEVTLDTSPPSGSPGVMALYAGGPNARRLAALSAEERRRVALGILVRRFGPQASSPLEVMDEDWAGQESSRRGGSMAHYGPGVMTQFGSVIREPVGPIHWAGTETATTSHGAIDGAVRSGERVAAELLA